MATRVKSGVKTERVENNTVVRNHRGHDVNVGAGSVVLSSGNGHTAVVDSDVYDALFEDYQESGSDREDSGQ